MFFVLRGAVRVGVRTAAGREIIFSDLAEGEQFGELAAIDGGARSASVLALRPSPLLVPAGEFRAAAAASPAMTKRLLVNLTSRVRTRSARFVEVAPGTVRHRLVAELMRLSRPRPGSEVLVISPPVRHHILAARIGVRPGCGRNPRERAGRIMA